MQEQRCPLWLPGQHQELKGGRNAPLTTFLRTVTEGSKMWKAPLLRSLMARMTLKYQFASSVLLPKKWRKPFLASQLKVSPWQTQVCSLISWSDLIQPNSQYFLDSELYNTHCLQTWLFLFFALYLFCSIFQCTETPDTWPSQEWQQYDINLAAITLNQCNFNLLTATSSLQW